VDSLWLLEKRLAFKTRSTTKLASSVLGKSHMFLFQLHLFVFIYVLFHYTSLDSNNRMLKKK
jgi:hypothetical protein